jgi:hypothetical protein
MARIEYVGRAKFEQGLIDLGFMKSTIGVYATAISHNREDYIQTALWDRAFELWEIIMDDQPIPRNVPVAYKQGSTHGVAFSLEDEESSDDEPSVDEESTEDESSEDEESSEDTHPAEPPHDGCVECEECGECACEPLWKQHLRFIMFFDVPSDIKLKMIEQYLDEVR